MTEELGKGPSSPITVSFADVAHQTLIFDTNDEASRLILALLDTPWIQRLRRIRQTGNTLLVYMFAEHSRFGHSLGVAYLANRLMKNLAKWNPKLVKPYQNAVAAAAILHDAGHVAPGSHLGERVWAGEGHARHEEVTVRIALEDPAIRTILESVDPKLPGLVADILNGSPNVPPWTKAIISGGGWNADRGNWAIVDSAMCSVTYGRYNVFALIDAFRITDSGNLVLQESRLDALTHFFVARDSMYRQVYQHRVLQAADSLTEKIVLRIRDLLKTAGAKTRPEIEQCLRSLQISADDIMTAALASKNYAKELPLDSIFRMTEDWWAYHVQRWCDAPDPILRDLATRYRDRRLFKTIRLEERRGARGARSRADFDPALLQQTNALAEKLGYDPRYYVVVIRNADKHRSKREPLPDVLLDNGEIVAVTEVEPLIAKLTEKSDTPRIWLAVPKEVKEAIGRTR